MEYLSIEDARQMSGLRIALSVGGPFAFGQAAKSIMELKNIPYKSAIQLPGQSNDELYEWTGFRNAPVLIYGDETPRAGWPEILYLAERINPLPRLIPKEQTDRAVMFGLGHKILSEDGFAWSCRLMLIQAMLTQENKSPAKQLGQVLGERYGYSDTAVANAAPQATEIMATLSWQLEMQRDAGSDYFVGSELSAVDIYWATCALMVAPLPEKFCPINTDSRSSFIQLGRMVEIDQYPALIEHRDMIYQRHLKLPLDF